MSQGLTNALTGKPWSLSELLFSLDHVLDAEGRPVTERRAPASVRMGVEMEMRACPYTDGREDKLMNHSALTQVTRFYNDVMAEVAGVRQLADEGQLSWSDILVPVLYQLLGPTLFLLKQKGGDAPLPAKEAVGYKLGAGYFGVMQTLFERRALGGDIPVTTPAFLDLVYETRALVGGAEVCAGSPEMLRNASRTLMQGDPGSAGDIDAVQLQLARTLALQFELGTFWRLFDATHYFNLIRGHDRQHLVPFNDFLQRKLDEAAAALGSKPAPAPVAERLPQGLDSGVREQLLQALQHTTPAETLSVDFKAAVNLLKTPGSVISFGGSKVGLALQFTRYLHCMRLFRQTMSDLEIGLRQSLGMKADSGVKLGPVVFAKPLALPWYERIVGCRLGDSGHLDGSQTGLRVPAATAG